MSHDIWNPWHGCTKCSTGCMNCYMYALDEMRKVKTPSDQCHKTGYFKYPLSKYRSTGEYKVKSGERLRVNMTSDTFLEDADEWRNEFWQIIRKRPDVIFWILTKRPERIMDHLPSDWGDGYENVCMNITCENQEMFDKRINIFLSIPAKHKGLCLAPLLSDIDITKALESKQIEEVSIGGENYNNPRPCNFDWVKHIAETCYAYKTNVIWYETGTNLIVNNRSYHIPSKQKQTTQAFFSRINRQYYDIKYKLTDIDGDILSEEKLYKRSFNLNHCLFCSNQLICNGCSECGNCENNRIIVDEKTFKHAQNEQLKILQKQKR